MSGFDRLKKTGRLLCLAIMLAPAAAHAEFPAHAIRLLVGYPPGGGGDLYGRAIATELGHVLHTSVVVENRPGAGGNIAATITARSKPDGYTLLLAMSSNIALAPVVMGAKLQYHVPADFTAIGGIAQAPHGLFVAAKSKYETAQQVFDAAKTSKLSYGSSGPGSVGYAAMEMVKKNTSLNVLPIPYSGSGPAILDLVSGRTDLFFATAPPVMNQVTSGNLRLLAITGEEPNPAMPGVPTFKQLGIDVTVTQWYGLVGPAGMPPEVVKTLSEALSKALDAPSVKAQIVRDGATELRLTPQQFHDFIVKDIARYQAGVPTALIEEAGK